MSRAGSWMEVIVNEIVAFIDIAEERSQQTVQPIRRLIGARSHSVADPIQELCAMIRTYDSFEFEKSCLRTQTKWRSGLSKRLAEIGIYDSQEGLNSSPP